MKKFFICLLAVAGLTLFSSFKQTSVPNVSANETNYEEVVLASNSTYTVRWIRFNGNITTRGNGEFDSDAMTLTVHGATYRVRSNPYQGDGTKRGDYRYMAGDYFFNF